jgi:osmotically inducible protein OsmC
VVLDNGAVTEIHLTTRAEVPGISAEDFAAAAEDAKTNCPISKLMNAAIVLDAALV